MPEIAKGQSGEISYDVAFVGGALKVSVAYSGAQAGASLVANVSAAALIGALAAKLTNPTEKALLEGLEAIIASIP